MTRSELLGELRELIDDLVLPFAWSDTRLMLLMSEGQDKFCEKTGFFTDNDTFTITTQAGVASYPFPTVNVYDTSTPPVLVRAIPNRIIQILEVWNGDLQLRKFTQGDRLPYASGFSDVRVPRGWQADQATKILTLDTPNPEADIVLSLRVWRYAKYPLTYLKDSLGFDVQPEIPETVQRACIEYAAWQCYKGHDKEEGDPIKARDHKIDFDNIVLEGKRLWRMLTAQESRVSPDPAYTV